jgi:hypothetical protein
MASLAIDSCDNLYVGWKEETDSCDIFIRFYDGNNWSSIMNITQDTLDSKNPKLGNPVKSNCIDLVWESEYDSWRTSEVLYLGINPTGIHEKSRQDNILAGPDILNAFPNPFHNEVTITWQLRDNSNYTIKIYDSYGRLVKMIPSRIKSQSKSAIWNGKNQYGAKLPTGIYFLELKRDNFLTTKKLIFQK